MREKRFAVLLGLLRFAVESGALVKGGFVWCCSCMGERLVGNCGRRNEFGKLGVGLTCWWRW